MTVPPEVFDEDYLYFYFATLGDERSEADAELVMRLLGLQPAMRVLDVPCGEGRIAGRMAARGCEVVGVDQSELFLGLARERWPQVTFEHGDMRSLPYEAEFDATVNWFTSDGDLMIDRVSYDPADGFSRTERFIVRRGEVRKVEFSLEQVPAAQIVDRLQHAGFGLVRLFGQGGGPFEPDGRRLIALAERAVTE